MPGKLQVRSRLNTCMKDCSGGLSRLAFTQLRTVLEHEHLKVTEARAAAQHDRLMMSACWLRHDGFVKRVRDP